MMDADSEEDVQRGASPVKPGTTTAYWLITCSMLTLMPDYGIMPACIMDVKNDLNMSKTDLGVMGTSIYTGLTIGTFLSDSLMNSKHWFLTLKLSFLISVFGSFWTSLATDKYSLCIARFIVGVAHAPASVYYPVWIDDHAPKDRQSTWMSIYQTMQPLGNLVGYIITGALVYQYGIQWRWMFRIFSFALLAIVFLAWALVPEDVWPVEQKERATPCDGFRDVLAYKRWWLCVMAPIVTYFLSTAVQYWGVIELGRLRDEWGEGHLVTPGEADWYIVFTCLPGSLAGNLVGGWAMDTLAGGYKNKKGALTMVAILSVVPVLMLPLTMYPTSVNSLMAGVIPGMFCGGVIISTIPGLLFTFVPPNVRISASSTFAFLSGCFGFQFAPVLVGAVAQYFSMTQSWAFWWVVCCGMNCAVLVSLCLWEYNDPAPDFDAENGEELEDFSTTLLTDEEKA